MFEGFFTVAGTLILVVGILVLCYFTTRKLERVQTVGGGGRYIRLLERIVIGQDKTIALVQAGDNYLLLGVASSQITVLMELNKEQLTELEVSQGQTADFKSILEMIKDRKK